MFDVPDPKGRRGSLHDQVFKDLIGRFLPDFLTLVAPEPAGRLDLSRWTFLDKETFTDWPKGKRRELDLLAEVAFADGSGRTALVHVEIEARSRREIGVRLAGYYMQIRLRHGRPIVSLLLSLRGGRPAVQIEVVVDAELGRETARFYYHSLSLKKSRAEDFLAKPQPLAWALAALMRAETLSRAEHKLACLQRIAAAPLDELHRFLLVNCVETYLQLEGRDAEELEALQAGGNAEEVQAMRRMTWAEQLVEQGLEQGREQGLEQGLEKGREQGFRQALLRQLGARFGPLSDDVRRRVEAIRSTERLNQIAEQILVAHSLEEMGLR
jgi:predicted transposase YdaD